MNEKTMVSDALVGVNGELKMFGDMIPQTENQELKQCLNKSEINVRCLRKNCTRLHGKKATTFPLPKRRKKKSITSDTF